MQEGKGWSSTEAARRPALKLCLELEELCRLKAGGPEGCWPPLRTQRWKRNSWLLVNFLVTAHLVHRTQRHYVHVNDFCPALRYSHLLRMTFCFLKRLDPSQMITLNPALAPAAESSRWLSTGCSPPPGSDLVLAPPPSSPHPSPHPTLGLPRSAAGILPGASLGPLLLPRLDPRMNFSLTPSLDC